MIINRVLFLILVTSQLSNGLVSMSDIGDIISFTHEIVIDVLQAWKIVGPLVQGDGPEHIDLPLVHDKEKKLLSKIAVVNKRVEQVDRLVQSVTSASMLNLKQDIPSQIRLELRIDTLLDLVSIVNFADNTFKEFLDVGYLDNGTEPNIERHTLESFATYAVSHSPTSVQGVLSRLHGMIYPDYNHGHAFVHQGILELIRKVLQGKLSLMSKTEPEIIMGLHYIKVRVPEKGEG